jgi:TRAP-type mannitol/chloroaromatic compound transport system permease small subunit
MIGGSGTSTVPIRAFGWIMLAILAVFLLNAVLTFWFDFPGAKALFAGTSENVFLSFVQLSLYALAIAAAVISVSRRYYVTLREDAATIIAANHFIIRAAFWVVFLVGLGDAILSFMRVEGLSELYFGEELDSNLGRSAYRATHFHVPLILAGIAIAMFTRSLGFIWLSLLVVVAELLIVISRFVFSYEQAFMGDLVRFWYGALFLFASAYTLLEDGHVRVDLLYAGMSRKKKGTVNAWGSIVLGMALCWTILIIGFSSANAVIVSPILVFEVTQSGFGMYVKYFMAGFLGIFAVTMMIQFVAQFFEAVADKRGDPGARKTHAEVI